MLATCPFLPNSALWIRHKRSSGTPLAQRTANAATAGVESFAGGWSRPPYLKVIFRQSDIVIETI